MPNIVHGSQVDAVLRTLSQQTTQCDLQLSILTRAIISAAKVIGVSQKTLVRELDKAWADTPPANATVSVSPGLNPPFGRH